MDIVGALSVGTPIVAWYEEHLSWHWIFWHGALLTPLMMLCIYLAIPNPSKKPGPKPALSWRGFLYGSLGLGLIYGALDQVERKTRQDPLGVFHAALENVMPSLEVRSRRVGGATYQVPVEVKASRSTTLALRWLVGYSRQRREKTMTERLMNELLDASNGLGASVKRREDTHKMAESNKAFAHYRW